MPVAQVSCFQFPKYWLLVILFTTVAPLTFALAASTEKLSNCREMIAGAVAQPSGNVPEKSTATTVSRSSGNSAGRVIFKSPSAAAAFKFLPPASSETRFTVAPKPGTTTMPSFGRSNTCRNSRFAFNVLTPHGWSGIGDCTVQ